MGIYRDHVLPRLQDKVMDLPQNRKARARVCDGLAGEVVEIGFGTGLNAPHYPADVSKVLAVEPSPLCLRLAEPRIAESAAPVEPAGLTGERLDLPSDRYDAVLSTWTFCTIPDLAAALSEIRRVLKPGGTLHFIEHGRSPDPNVQRWQRRIEPAWKHVAGGCHLTREIPDAVDKAGLAIDELDTYYLEGDPKPFGFTFEGRAVKA